MPKGVYVRKIRPVADRFWEKVDRSGDCWEWTASLGTTGYGQFGVDKAHKCVKAHRVAYELTHGPIPDGLFVCHHCDNPKCVRPDHLFLGTRSDNVADMVAKGRQSRQGGRRGEEHYFNLYPEKRAAASTRIRAARKVRGEHHGQARLTADAVRDIRARYAAGIANQYELAAEYGISQTAIWHVLQRRTWKHVA